MDYYNELLKMGFTDKQLKDFFNKQKEYKNTVSKSIKSSSLKNFSITRDYTPKTFYYHVVKKTNQEDKLATHYENQLRDKLQGKEHEENEELPTLDKIDKNTINEIVGEIEEQQRNELEYVMYGTTSSFIDRLKEALFDYNYFFPNVNGTINEENAINIYLNADEQQKRIIEKTTQEFLDIIKRYDDILTEKDIDFDTHIELYYAVINFFSLF